MGISGLSGFLLAGVTVLSLSNGDGYELLLGFVSLCSLCLGTALDLKRLTPPGESSSVMHRALPARSSCYVSCRSCVVGSLAEGLASREMLIC